MSDSPWTAVAASVVDATRQVRETIDAIRRRNEVFAKSVGGLGVTALTAVGIVEFSDVFPVPPGTEAVAVAVVAGFVGMALLVAAFAMRLNHANRVIKVSSDEAATLDDVDEVDRDMVRALYRSTADLNDARSLADYEARGHRFARDAEETNQADRRDNLIARAQLIAAEVRLTTVRAAADVLRARSVRAFSFKRIWPLGLAFLACLLVFALGSDYLESERTDRVSTTKACAEAIKAVGEAGASDKAARELATLLPEICDGGAASAVAEPRRAAAPTAVQQRAQAVEALAAQYRACVEAAEENSGDPAECEPVRALAGTAVRDAAAR